MCPRCVRAFRNAARIEVVSPRPVSIATQIEVLSLRLRSNAAQIEVVSPRPASIAARIEVVSQRPASIAAQIEVLSPRPASIAGIVLYSSISSILCPSSFRDTRTGRARIADQVDQMSPESSEDYKARRVTNGVTRN
ncbi:hypothetical protein ACE6H2_023558 [Prunus campanulata]